MKVRVEYADGHYALTNNVSAGMNAIEISDEEWQEYCAFRASDIKWYLRLQDLDNELFAKDHPDEEIVA